MKEGMNMGPNRRDFLKASIGAVSLIKTGRFVARSEQLDVPLALQEAGPEIMELETLIASFESEHPLLDLYAITDLTFEESRSHPIREPARVALFPIVAKRNALKNETNISPEKYTEINEKYMRLSRAVGMLTNNKVDHTR